MSYKIHSAVIAQVAQLAKKINPTLFEQRVFGIINAYAKHECSCHGYLYSANIIYTNKVKVDHIAVSNNIIYMLNSSTYDLYMYVIATCQQTICNVAYSHFANRKLEPVYGLVDTVSLNLSIDNMHVEDNNVIINVGYGVIKYVLSLVNSCFYIIDGKKTMYCHFNKIMYRILTFPNGVDVLYSDCKFVALKYKHYRLYVGYYIVVSELIKTNGIYTKIHIYDKDLVFIKSFTICEIIKKICISKRLVYALTIYNGAYAREIFTETKTYIGGVIDMFNIGDILFTLDEYNTVTKYEFN